MFRDKVLIPASNYFDFFSEEKENKYLLCCVQPVRAVFVASMSPIWFNQDRATQLRPQSLKMLVLKPSSLAWLVGLIGQKKLNCVIRQQQ